MMTVSQGSTKPQPAVIETRPPSRHEPSGVGRRHEPSGVGRRHVVHRERAPWIEAVPPEPQGHGPEDDKGYAVRGVLCLVHLGFEASLAGPDDDGTAERPNPADHVDEAAPCEVLVPRAEGRDRVAVVVRVAEEARAAPAPVDR